MKLFDQVRDTLQVVEVETITSPERKRRKLAASLRLRSGLVKIERLVFDRVKYSGSIVGWAGRFAKCPRLQKAGGHPQSRLPIPEKCLAPPRQKVCAEWAIRNDPDARRKCPQQSAQSSTENDRRFVQKESVTISSFSLDLLAMRRARRCILRPVDHALTCRETSLSAFTSTSA